MKNYYAKYGNSNGATGDMSGSGWTQATGVDDGPLYGDSEASVAYRDALEKAKAEAQTAVLVFSRVGNPRLTQRALGSPVNIRRLFNSNEKCICCKHLLV